MNDSAFFILRDLNFIHHLDGHGWCPYISYGLPERDTEQGIAIVHM